jgi:hypothetical protein
MRSPSGEPCSACTSRKVIRPEHGGRSSPEIDLLGDRTGARNLSITQPTNQRIIPVPPSLAGSLRTARFDFAADASGAGLRTAVFGGRAGSSHNFSPAVAAIGSEHTYLLLPTFAQFSKGFAGAQPGQFLRAGRQASHVLGDRVPGLSLPGASPPGSSRRDRRQRPRRSVGKNTWRWCRPILQRGHGRSGGRQTGG